MVSCFIGAELEIYNTIFSHLVNLFQASRLKMLSHLQLIQQDIQLTHYHPLDHMEYIQQIH